MHHHTTCVSAFVLFLCREDLRRWFLQQEMDLLRYRFNELTDSLRQKFLQHVNLSFEAVSVLLAVSCCVCLLLCLSGLKEDACCTVSALVPSIKCGTAAVNCFVSSSYVCS